MKMGSDNMKELQLPICALFFSALLCIVYFSKKRVKIIENKIYTVMLFMGLLDSIILTIERFLVRSGNMNDVTPLIQNILQITNKIDFIALIILCTCLFLYTLVISMPKIKDKMDYVIKVVGVIDLMVFIYILFLNVDLINSGSIISVSGGGIIPAYITCGVYIVLSILITLINVNRLTKKHIPIISIIFIFIFLMLVFKNDPYIMIISITVTFVNYLMYFTIENPDMRIIHELNQAKKRIEQTNKDQARFLLDITGEMRGTINELDGIANEVIRATEENKTKEEMYQLRYLLSGARLRLDQTLNITTLDHKNIRLMGNTYNFRKILKEVELHLKNKIAKEVTYRSILSSTIPEVLYGESIRIKQILTTLLSNAFEYTENGYVELHINSIIKADLCRLIITIEDTGCGMPLYQINELLDDHTISEKEEKVFDKLNLTLSQVNKLIKMLGGTLDIESKENKGTKVIVTLDQQIVPQQQKDLKDIEEIEEVMFNKKKIAVIDNKDGLYKKIIKALDKMDVETIEFKSAKACLDRIRKEKDLDLIICQENLEKIDARNLLEKVQKEELQVPIILVNEEEEYDLKRLKIEGFASAIYEEEIATQLVKKVNIILNKEKNMANK